MNLSIIIPHYNSTAKLERLLKSIPKNKDLEIIIIDDYSNEEKVREKLEKISILNNIKIIFNTKKKGAGTCRNIGIENSSGKWILFADADDYFQENAFMVIKKYFQSNYDIIYFIPTSFNEINRKKSNRHLIYENLINNYKNKKNKIYKEELKTGFVVPWSKMISKNLITSSNIKFEEVMYGNDLLFSLKCGLNSKKIKIDEEKIYCVTENFDTLTTTKSKVNYEIRYNSFVQYNLELKNSNKKLYQISTLNLGKSLYLISNEKKYLFREFFLSNNYYSLLRKLIKKIVF